jgi:hypothetical protein
VVGAVALVALSAALVGPRAYVEFFPHIRALRESAMTNLMGMKTIAVFDWATRVDRTFDARAGDAYAVWGQLRALRAHALAPLLVGIGVASFALVVWAGTKRRTLWQLLPLGLLLVVGLLELMNYYYAVFLLAPLLAARGARYEIFALGAAALSAILVPWGRISSALDTRCYFQSWVFVGLALLLVVDSVIGGSRGRAAIDS